MKTIIFSLTIMLAFALGSASAQTVNGYNANQNAGFHPGKGDVKIHFFYTDPVKDVSWPNPTCNIIPEKHTAKYISPLGFLLKTVKVNTGTANINPGKMVKKLANPIK